MSKKVKGKFGPRKKVTAWRDWVLVKWSGYSIAESTWEADMAFYEQHYPHLLAAYAQERVAERVLTKTTHPQSGIAHYKVAWRGSRMTTMEPAATVEKAPQFVELLKQYREQRE